MPHAFGTQTILNLVPAFSARAYLHERGRAAPVFWISPYPDLLGVVCPPTIMSPIRCSVKWAELGGLLREGDHKAKARPAAVMVFPIDG
jgi:hypothetical protein